MGAISDILEIRRGIKERRAAKAGGGGGGGSGGSGGDTDDPGAPSYKRGGKVRKTGMARLHKGEYVLTAKQARSRKRGKRR